MIPQVISVLPGCVMVVYVVVVVAVAPLELEPPVFTTTVWMGAATTD
jgi:hypothetical protein